VSGPRRDVPTIPVRPLLSPEREAALRRYYRNRPFAPRTADENARLVADEVAAPDATAALEADLDDLRNDVARAGRARRGGGRGPLRRAGRPGRRRAPRAPPRGARLAGATVSGPRDDGIGAYYARCAAERREALAALRAAEARGAPAAELRRLRATLDRVSDTGD